MSSIKERVIHVLDPIAASHIPLFLPRVAVTRGSADEGEEEIRPFQNGSDIERVMDYSNMPDPPQDCLVMHCEAPGVGNEEEAKDDDGSGIVFPKRSAHLRGGYIFLSQPKDKNDNGSANSSGSKIACIPLAGCSVDFPPGGRRVFREHAHTGARAGYEMAIQVKSNDASKITCYIVLDSLGLRESWASAIRLRCDVGNKITKVRPGGIAGSRLMSAGEDIDGYYDKGSKNNLAGPGSGISRSNKKQKQWGLQKPHQADGPASSGNADLDAAIDQFGTHGFQEEKWLHEYLRKNSARELPGECDKLEKWMDVIKNGLRGAVLEQYEYFVEASREMSTMGREVAWIRTLVERQQEVLMSMKNIDFGTGLEEMDEAAGDDEYGYLSDEEKAFQDAGRDDSSIGSSSSEESSSKGNARTPMRGNRRPSRIESLRKPSGAAGITPIDEGEPTVPSNSIYVDIPAYLSDITEEASAFIKESRYSDATALILKGKNEIADILEGHEQHNSPVVNVPPSLRRSNSTQSAGGGGGGKKLHKKQQALLQRTNLQLDALMDRMAKRLAENLRRKNEALKASAKRERADPLSTLAPLVSPVCLNDDAVALHLLVKLGRHQEAATAYAARRSLLLSECLHERPISSPVGMDAVIYAAQLSSSFFSSLAMAVEGFLDLFMDPDADKNSGNDDNTSINSSSGIGGGGKRVPSGALAAIVLWCDSELAKFTNVFGSSRLLSGLALSPPGLRNQADSPQKKISLAKEREHSIEVAAKCVEQAFSFASENLDSIGLPLTPKLAENMRPRLKGCEAEIAALLDPRWKALSFEWTQTQERAA
eukprot:scaffold15937_cov141-Skeletonema_marinoi.AAC.9